MVMMESDTAREGPPISSYHSSEGDTSALVPIDSDVNSMVSQDSDAGVVASEEVSVSEDPSAQGNEIEISDPGNTDSDGILVA